MQDPRVRAAAAKMRLQCTPYFSLGGVRSFLEKGLRPHHHPRDAVAALRSLRLDEGALHRAGLVQRAQALERLDLALLHRPDRRDPGLTSLAFAPPPPPPAPAD